MAIAYINSTVLIERLESIMEYHGLGIIETNTNFRVFNGHFNGSPSEIADRLNTELDDAVFSVEDSLFIVYPCKSDKGRSSFSNIIIKRKGNKLLRKNVLK
jgi:hypothetical protein